MTWSGITWPFQKAKECLKDYLPSVREDCFRLGQRCKLHFFNERGGENQVTVECRINPRRHANARRSFLTPHFQFEQGAVPVVDFSDQDRNPPM